MFEISYQNPATSVWSVTNMFHKFHQYISDQIECVHVEPSCVGSGSPDSQHVMIIRNVITKKYIVVSYWDNAIDIFNDSYGWDSQNMVEMFTSSGVFEEMKFTPFSYMAYSIRFEEFSKNKKPFSEKLNNELSFRGFLYGMRRSLFLLDKIKMFNEKIPEFSYFQELDNNKICLSLNGMGEICNRDMEILSAGSVLFRPLLTQKFHNDLIPNFHYIPFEVSSDAAEQMEIIQSKFDEIKDNEDFLLTVAENGHNWYLQNGTTQANVDILKQIINIDLIK